MQTQNLLDDELAVGIPSIDAEHRQLICELNRLMRAPQNSATSEPFSENISRIGQIIIEHFQHEEEILGKHGLDHDEIVRHVSAHNRIIEQFTQLQFDLMSGKAINCDEVLAMIRSWIVTHLVSYDLKLRPEIADSSCSH